MSRVRPNGAMKLVLRRLNAHEVPVDQLADGGPTWTSGCPNHDHRTGPSVTWRQRPDGTVTVGIHRRDGNIVCQVPDILGALAIDDDRIAAANGYKLTSAASTERKLNLRPAAGGGPFVKPARTEVDSYEILEKLRAKLHEGGYAGNRARTDRYTCPSCGEPGNGRGLRITHKPNAVGKRKILLICDKGRCPVEDILEPLDMTVAEVCAGDDTDDLGDDGDGDREQQNDGCDVEFTDAHLAQRAVDDVLRDAYCWAHGLGWLRWDGARWKPTPDPEIREKLRRWAINAYEAAGRDVARALRRGDKKEANRLTQVEGAWYRVCSKTRLGAVADLARGIVLRDGAAFDQQPDLLNCPNGAVDLRTGEIHDHDPDLLFTKVTGIDYTPDARHKDWTQALRALDDDVADWMQLRCGQAATGHPPDDDIIPICQGAGKNGKSTIFTGIARALGEFHTLVSDRVILANPGDHPTELMELRGARFALIEETPEERKFDVQRIKKITGTADITARLIAQNSVTFTVTHSLMVTSNHRPVITQTDYGTWRRLALIRFPHTFNGDDADPNLRDRVKRDVEVHRAVLAWIVAGARRWYDNDRVITPAPGVVLADTEDWRSGSDLILGYWRDRLIPELNVHVMAAELYADFTAWLEAHGQQAWAERTFVERFREHEETERHKIRKDRARSGPELHRPDAFTATKPPPERYNAWIGVRFRQASDLDERDVGMGGMDGLVDLRVGDSLENRLSLPSHPSRAPRETDKEDARHGGEVDPVRAQEGRPR